MSYVNVVAGAYIRYMGKRWNFERRQDHRLEWRCENTFEHAILTDAELQREIRLGNVKLFDGRGREPEGKTSRVLGQRAATEEDTEEARRRLRYVLAVHDAKLLRPDATPADWKDVIDQVYETEGRFWLELRGRNKGRVVAKPHRKSVGRWAVTAGSRPTLNKLVPRHRHKGRYDDRIDPELRDLMADLIEKHYLARPPITLMSLRDIIHGEMASFNERRREQGRKALEAPGLNAIQSQVDQLPGDVVKAKRYGKMAAFLSYGSAEAQKDPEAPLDRVELDSTPMDLFVVDPDSGLPIGRPTLVVALDRCTRMVLGWFVTFEKPSVHALMQCLRNAMLSKDYVQQIKEERGWIIHNEPETFGVPRVLVLDRGRENIAEHIAHFAVQTGINRVEITAGKKPWLKGAVERVIKTISERLLHPTRGTTFHNMLKRMEYDPLKDAVCTPDDLDYGLHKFFIDIYPFEERRSLNGRQAIKVWREKTRIHPVDSVGTLDEVAHLFGRSETAKPGRHGINYANMQYFSQELLGLLANGQFQKALRAQGGEIRFHVDPGDLGQIHVRLPHRNTVITVPVARKWQKYAIGLSLWHHRKIRQFASAEARQDAALLLQSKLELMEIMRGTALSKRGGLRARGVVARMEGVQRMAPAGDDARNTVSGSDAHAGGRRGRPRPSNDVGDSTEPGQTDADQSPQPEPDADTPPDSPPTTGIGDEPSTNRRKRSGYRP